MHPVQNNRTISPITDAVQESEVQHLAGWISEGVDLAAYEARWRTRPDAKKIDALVEQDLLTLDGNILRATPRGRLLLNAVIAELLN